MTESNAENPVRDYHTTLRRVGIAFFVIGAWVFAAGLYSTLTARRGTIDFAGFFYWIPAVMLYRGRLWVARVAAFFSGLYVGAFGLSFLLALPFVPPPLVWPLMRSGDFRWYGQLLLSLVMLALAFWIYLKTSDPYLPRDWEEADTDQVPPRRRAWVGLALGIALAISSLSSAVQLLYGPTAQNLLRQGERKLGAQYRYYLSDLTIRDDAHGHTVRANLLAYNWHDLKRLSAGWKDTDIASFPGYTQTLKMPPLHLHFPLAGSKTDTQSSS